MCEICSKLTTKTSEQRHWRRSVIFIINLFTPFSSVSIVDFAKLFQNSFFLQNIFGQLLLLGKNCRVSRRKRRRNKTTLYCPMSTKRSHVLKPAEGTYLSRQFICQFIVEFEQVNVCWASIIRLKFLMMGFGNLI